MDIRQQTVWGRRSNLSDADIQIEGLQCSESGRSIPGLELQAWAMS